MHDNEPEHEAEAKSKATYCEAEGKNLASRPCGPPGLNIPERLFFFLLFRQLTADDEVAISRLQLNLCLARPTASPVFTL